MQRSALPISGALRGLLVVAGLLLGAAAASDEPPANGADGNSCAGVTLRFVDDAQSPRFGSLRAEGLSGDDASAARLEVYVGPKPIPVDRPAVLGRSIRDGATLTYEPRFRFMPGMHYLARMHTGSCSTELAFRMPEPEATDAPTRVQAVYPSATTVPANLLRMYVTFSASMFGKDVARYVRLEDDRGLPVELPFVEVEHGLWDPSMRRLTLFLHPGRIKRGVGPNETMGPVLQPGRHYSLVVDGALKDGRGRPLAAPFRHRFEVTTEDRTAPNLDDWRIEAPAHLGDRLAVLFPEPLDRALLMRWIDVRDAAGRSLEGSVEVDEGERRWRFRPDRPWSPGRYGLHVHPALEDLAGNTPTRLFDVATASGARSVDPAPAEARVLPFEVPR